MGVSGSFTLEIDRTVIDPSDIAPTEETTDTRTAYSGFIPLPVEW